MSEIEYPFRALLQALRDKDAELYERLKNLSPSKFGLEWREKYPEDLKPR